MDDVFTTRQVLELLSRRPDLAALNAMVEQRYSAEQPA
jgi:hypothetical protein